MKGHFVTEAELHIQCTFIIIDLEGCNSLNNLKQCHAMVKPRKTEEKYVHNKIFSFL